MPASRLLSSRRDFEKMEKRKQMNQMRKTLTVQKAMKGGTGLLDSDQAGFVSRLPQMVMGRSLSIGVTSCSVGMGSTLWAEVAKTPGSAVAKMTRMVNVAVVALVAS